jgi:phage terminase large subunit
VTEHVYRVRWYQQAFHRALVERTHDRLIAIWHRRAGKDDVLLDAMRTQALKNPGTYWHCFPEQKQARKAIWNGVNGNTGKRRIFEAFPPAIIKRMQDDDMFIELNNVATFQLIGSDRYDSTVGSGPKGIGYSEWALSNPAAWAYHQPMIRETKGFAAFITTPRGRNHAKTMYDNATGPQWFRELLTVEDTQALSHGDIADALAEYVGLYGVDMGTSLFNQEYLCDFNAAILGAFYAREMLAVRNEGRVDPDLVAMSDRPVHRAWDIGVRDDTSIWWFQVVGGQVFILDCYSASGVGVDHYAEIVEQRRREHGWQDGTDFVPHDAKVKEWGTGRTRVETMQSLGLKPQLVPMAGLLDGINAVRRTLPLCVFHPRAEAGISALEQYRREWDDEKKVFKANPLHDFTSHYADSFRYMAMAWRTIPPAVELPPAPVVRTIHDLIAPPLETKRRR